MTTISVRNILLLVGIIFCIQIQTASAQCSLQTLCIEMKIVVIGCGTVAVAAIIGFVVLACRGSNRRETPKKQQPNVRKSKIKSVVVYDEIDEPTVNEKQKNKEDNRYRYEEVVIKRNSGLNYDDLVHRRRKSKIPTPKGLFKKKRRVQVLKSVVTAKENVYSVNILENEHDNETTSDNRDDEKQVVIELEQFDAKNKTRDTIISETNTQCSFVENDPSDNAVQPNGDCSISSEIASTETSSLDSLKMQKQENKFDKIADESYKLNGNQNGKNDSCETDELNETDSKTNTALREEREVLTNLKIHSSETSNYDNSFEFMKDRIHRKPLKKDKPSNSTKNNFTDSTHNQRKAFTQQDNENEKITDKKKDIIDQVDDRIEYVNLKLK
ncbi:uncharacterized protein LOC127700557 isoform X1 [Mytilus californianus]|uniref:uncharacterized protein LOC127700557 isoform X1 n=1 Tax=Mytilus californianus TaxID=6549 RepID=UPI0022462A78|nr:uncharacterized protein LOC127700557 isoform X1 [Mytilus californianus]